MFLIYHFAISVNSKDKSADHFSNYKKKNTENSTKKTKKQKKQARRTANDRSYIDDS